MGSTGSSDHCGEGRTPPKFPTVPERLTPYPLSPPEKELSLDPHKHLYSKEFGLQLNWLETIRDEGSWLQILLTGFLMMHLYKRSHR